LHGPANSCWLAINVFLKKDEPTVSPGDDPLNQLIRKHLEREEAKVDPAAVLAGVRARQARPQSGSPSRTLPWLRWGAGFLTMAAALILMLWGVPSGNATAETLVRQAREVHAGPVDRLYQIDTQLETSWSKRFPILQLNRKVQLWTRGDRYHLIATNDWQQIIWGKDEQGRHWLSLNPKVGLIFNADELDDINLSTELYSMKLESLLVELPKGFDLRRESIPDRPGFARIVALPKRNLPQLRLREASLEMDEKSKVIQKLTLRRTVRDNATAIVTYTLLETKTLSDSAYHLKGHLEADVVPLGPESRLVRDRIWKKVLEKRVGNP
jgi:hypothetical protein